MRRRPTRTASGRQKPACPEMRKDGPESSVAATPSTARCRWTSNGGQCATTLEFDCQAVSKTSGRAIVRRNSLTAVGSAGLRLGRQYNILALAGQSPDGRPIVALVLAGGTGTRLYPASRSDRPKQFLSVGEDESLLAETVSRVGFADETYVRLGTRSPTGSGSTSRCSSVTEPVLERHRAGTGVCGPPHPRAVDDCVLLCLPSDHRISRPFETVARTATRVAVETEGLVTVGIEPDRPATGYGYINPDRPRRLTRPFGVPRETRRQDGPRVRRGRHYWNAGIFAWTPTLSCRGSDLAACTHGRATRRRGPRRRFADADPVSIR